MTEPRAKRTHRRPAKGTVILLVAGAAFIGLASIVGVSDNPPGIVLLYLAGITIVLAGTHRWRNPRSFGLLLIASAVGFVLNVLIHNFSEVGAVRIAQFPVLAALLGGVSVVTFFLGVIVCPMGGVVGVLGGIVTGLRSRFGAA